MPRYIHCNESTIIDTVGIDLWHAEKFSCEYANQQLEDQLQEDHYFDWEYPLPWCCYADSLPRKKYRKEQNHVHHERYSLQACHESSVPGLPGNEPGT